MRLLKRVCGLLLFLPLLAVNAQEQTEVLPEGSRAWDRILFQHIELYGQRNWIVIADAAFPVPSREGIETVVTGADQVDVLRGVLTELDRSKHVRAIAYTDAELKYVPEQEAPGAEGYRQQLAQLLGERPVSVLPQEQVVSRLDKASESFRVLILKTNLMVPYSAVFLQLDSKYWNAAAEQRLRDAMRASGG